MTRFIRAFVCASAFLAGCSSGGGGGGGSTSFSGTILGPSGTGLQGAGIQMSASTNLGGDPAQTVTDAGGNFIVLQPPTGMVDLHIDGSNVPGGTFANLELKIVVGGGASNLTQPIVLPDLGAGTTMSVPVDANGVTMGDMMVVAPDGSALTIPDMTTILVDGAIPAGTVDVNVTPVDAINVPMPLPGMQDAGAFVTIQPPGAAFTPALDITLPNTRGFPLGTMVDIWSFDHQDGAWVNRSAQTLNQGTVVDIGGMEFIVATGVITEGGWHAGTLPVDPTKATTIAGQVFPLGGSTPLPGVLISLSTGQFANTDANGQFSIASVPAYDAATLLPIDVDLRAIAPVAFGAMTVSMTILAGTIVQAGTTNVPPFDIPVSNTGSLVGSVTDGGVGVEGTVALSGTSKLDVATDSFGSFFVAALDPGPYTATFPFTNGDESEAFTIAANQTTFVSLTAGPPPAGGALTVQVLDFTSETSVDPVASACVTLQGAGGAPMFMTTNASGIATYSSAPSGPYTVTAQKDSAIPGGTLRLATTLVGVNPTVVPRTIVIPFFDDGGIVNPVVTDATLDGTILNDPGGVDFHYQIATEEGGGFGASNLVFGTSFSDNIPSGLPLDIAVWATDSITSEIVSAVFVSSFMAVPGANLKDFDFANACAFDRPVTATYTNVQTPGTFVADLDLRGAGELCFPFSDGSSLPASFNWPDLSNPKLAAFDGFFDTGTEITSSTFSESFCELPLGTSTPASLLVAFLGPPTIQAPANNANFPSYGAGSVVQYTLGSGNGNSTGFNSITFFGESKANGLFIFWDILVPATTTSVTLPPVFASKPMFPGGFNAVNVGTVRFDFPGFVFATFFDQNLPANVAAVEASEICEADLSHFFTVDLLLGASDGPSAADRARIQRRAELAGLRAH